MEIDFFGTSSSRSPLARLAILNDPGRSVTVTDDYLSYGRDYYDNPDLGVGYGGYDYDGRYAQAAADMCEHYGLVRGDRVLEVGCAKGFLLVEFFKLGMEVRGIDASEYALSRTVGEIGRFVQLGDMSQLPFDDGQFDLVVAKDTLPHVAESEIARAISECMRVSRANVFFEIQCGRTDDELRNMLQWDATHKIAKPPQWWNSLFERIGYNGDVNYKILIPQG